MNSTFSKPHQSFHVLSSSHLSSGWENNPQLQIFNKNPWMENRTSRKLIAGVPLRRGQPRAASIVLRTSCQPFLLSTWCNSARSFKLSASYWTTRSNMTLVGASSFDHHCGMFTTRFSPQHQTKLLPNSNRN